MTPDKQTLRIRVARLAARLTRRIGTRLNNGDRSAPGDGASRRTALRRVLTGLTGAVGAFTVLRSRPAEAMSRTNLSGTAAGAAPYGLIAIRGQVTDPAVYLPTITNTEHGVIGMTDQTFVTPVSSCGVLGLSSNRTAVLGMDMFGIGVRGYTSNGTGVLGEVPATSTANTIAMYGLNNSSYAGPVQGAGGFGIYGISAKGHGLVGATAAAGAAALVGATNGVAGAYAGAFYGPLIVGGDFTVFGGAKSAAVPHPDGSHRRLYCMESPESWFEDFGEASLDCGEAMIPLDPDFAAVVDTSAYHVFLTSYGVHAGLAVFDRSAEGFRVRAKEQAQGRFSWRVVAKRKDIPGARFAHVEIPKAPELPPLPTD